MANSNCAICGRKLHFLNKAASDYSIPNIFKYVEFVTGHKLTDMEKRDVCTNCSLYLDKFLFGNDYSNITVKYLSTKEDFKPIMDYIHNYMDNRKDDGFKKAFLDSCEYCVDYYISRGPKDMEAMNYCNVCGKVFCYSVEEYLKYYHDLNTGEALGNIADALFAPIIVDEIRDVKAKIEQEKKESFKKCPNCGSSDFKRITKEEFDEIKKQEENTSTNQNQQNNASDPIEQVKKLKELLDIGAITQEEFDAKKKELLNL